MTEIVESKGVDRVSSLGLGYHVFWIIVSALILAYSVTHLILSYYDVSIGGRLLDFALVALWSASLAQTIAVVAQGRYKHPRPVTISLIKKATAEDVR